MGRWGYEPRASDSAQDMFCLVDHLVQDALRTMFGVRRLSMRRTYRDLVRYARQFQSKRRDHEDILNWVGVLDEATRRDFEIPIPVCLLVQRGLRDALKDPHAFDRFQDPLAAREMAETWQHRIASAMAEHEGRLRRMREDPPWRGRGRRSKGRRRRVRRMVRNPQTVRL